MSDQSRLAYTGVHVDDIVDSVRRAAAFAKETVTTPQAQEALDVWLSCEPFQALAGATSPQEVGDALKSTETINILQAFHDIIAFHALDTSGAPFNGAQIAPLDLYEDLARWGAFDFDDVVKPDTKLMNEVNAYLGVRYAKAINTDDLTARNRDEVFKSPPTRQRFLQYSKYLREKYTDYPDISTDVSKKLEAYAGFLRDVHETGFEEAMEQYSTYDEKQQMMFADFSKHCLGLNMRHKLLHDMSSVKTYELSLSLMPIGRYVENRLERLLHESRKSGDVRHIRAGELHNGEYGYLISGTMAAAKLVAGGFSGDHVYDPGGVRISPHGGEPGGPDRQGPSPG